MRHDSYLPSSPATLQALDRMEYAMTNVIAPPGVWIVGPHFNVSSHSPSVSELKTLAASFLSRSFRRSLFHKQADTVMMCVLM